jgi:hypothetical protein
MENGFELPAQGFICENQAREFVTPQLAIGSQNIRPEKLPNFFQCRLPRLNDLPGEDIGIGYLKAALL